jgi:hypothetical protein
MDGCSKQSGSGFVGGFKKSPGHIPPPPKNGPQIPSYNDKDWENVTLPHDYVVLQEPSPNDDWSHGYKPRNISWYRKKITLDATWREKSVWLEFDGVYRSSDMWLNGIFLGHHLSGYTSFRYRIDNFPGVNFGGTNVLSVRLDPRGREGWWYEGAGIYRHTYVVVTDPVHVAPWGVYVPSEVVGAVTTNAQGRFADSVVRIYTNVSNASPHPAQAYVFSKIFNPDGIPIWTGKSETLELNSGTSATVFQQSLVRNAALWDIEKPYLYKLVSTVVLAHNGQEVDSVNTTFGMRKATFSPNSGFFLNGRSVKVTGMCNHQDFAGVGVAVPNRVNRFRVETLQKYGVNAWRMSHNPPNPELLDATDELGMLVWDENRFFGDFPTWYQDLADMILRDRNHPSIVWWSLCNEWGCQQLDQDVTIAIGVRFREIVKSLDLTRPISGAWNGDMTTGIRWATNVCDIMGINYNYGSFDPFHNNLPDVPLISSESCSCTSDRTFFSNSSESILGPYNAWTCIRDCWKPIATRNFVMGSFDWTGFDYRGEESPTRWPAINSHFGALDLSGFPKDDIFYLQAWFQPAKPIVHLVPQNWNFESQPSSLFLSPCSSAPSWKFVSASGALIIQSVQNPGSCLQGQPSYPAHLSPCNSSDPSFLFHTDDFGQIFWMHGSDKMCLDIEGGSGPDVGFWACKNAKGSNQDWSYDSGSGQLASSSSPSSCLAAGIQVFVYTNGDEVDLYLNGKLVGHQSLLPFDSGVFTLSFLPGNLTAVVRKQGSPWGRDTVVTTGMALSLILKVDSPSDGSPIFSCGQDAAILQAYVVDSSGWIVRTATDVITFSTTSGGFIRGTGNGNPSDHSPDQSNQRALWNGYARAVVGATRGVVPGQFSVTASAPGLKSAQVVIKTQPPVGD